MLDHLMASFLVGINKRTFIRNVFQLKVIHFPFQSKH